MRTDALSRETKKKKQDNIQPMNVMVNRGGRNGEVHILKSAGNCLVKGRCSPFIVPIARPTSVTHGQTTLTMGSYLLQVCIRLGPSTKTKVSSLDGDA
eukprot:15337545-Ditylum_brightwellii.AAC.1